MAAEHEEFVLFSLEVSRALVKGMAFTELSAFTGEDFREVQLDIPKAYVHIFQQIDGFQDYSPEMEALNVIKPSHGLTYAPRAWRKNPHVVLIGRLSRRQLHAEFELYVAHEYRDSNNNWNTDIPPQIGPNTVE